MTARSPKLADVTLLNLYLGTTFMDGYLTSSITSQCPVTRYNFSLHHIVLVEWYVAMECSLLQAFESDTSYKFPVSVSSAGTTYCQHDRAGLAIHVQVWFKVGKVALEMPEWDVE